MDPKQRLDRAIAQWNLLEHPFYQAWSAGRLPQDALCTYAQEYGAFIALLPQGWQTLNDQATAQEEQEHCELWHSFAQGLDTQVSAAHIPQVKNLIDVAQTLFAQPSTALGALYAFEAQQPATAESKLAGLKAFYRLPRTVEPYFEVHACNQHESEKLLARMSRLSSAEQSRALVACETMSRALWEALSGIYEGKCMSN